MKLKSLNLIALFLFAVTSISAQYLPFVEEGKFWIYTNHFQSDMPSAISSHAITFKGDTLINSLMYKKVFRYNLKGDHDCPPHERPCFQVEYPYQAESKWLISFVREDLDEKKVYHLPIDSNEFCASGDHLLFDFSLMVGDTLNDCLFSVIGIDTEPGVGVVDSIKMENAYDKARNTLWTYGFEISIGLPFPSQIPIYEGVGAGSFGIFYKPLSVFSDFCEGDIERCNSIFSNDRATYAVNEINIFPNPSDGLFQLSLQPQFFKSMKVYSIFGKLMSELEVKSELDLRTFKSGVYVVELVTKDDYRIVQKVIIQ